MRNRDGVESERQCTIAIAGDVMLGRLVNDAMFEHGWGHPWGKLTPLLWRADAFLINLECAITPRVVRWHDGHYKPFHFRADPGAIESLRMARVDCASIADARALADLVIFSVHWGPNMRAHPAPEFREFARRVIEAGADLFWGQSAHVVQGIELYHGRPILYDTGDFVDDYAVDRRLRNDLSALFLLDVVGSRIERIQLVPLHIGHMQVNLATEEDRRWLGNRLARLCEEMGTDVTDIAGRLTIDVRVGAHAGMPIE